jgi:hypothetical protein
MSVELKAADKKLLAEALKALNLKFTETNGTFTVTTPTGQITIANDQASFPQAAQGYVNKIKQAYSFQTVKAMAKKYKFNVVNKGGEIVLRRY